jgi:hypothetical protein
MLNSSAGSSVPNGQCLFAFDFVFAFAVIAVLPLSSPLSLSLFYPGSTSVPNGECLFVFAFVFVFVFVFVSVFVFVFVFLSVLVASSVPNGEVFLFLAFVFVVVFVFVLSLVSLFPRCKAENRNWSFSLSVFVCSRLLPKVGLVLILSCLVFLPYLAFVLS